MMKRGKSMKRKCLAVGIILLFIGTAVIPSSGQPIEKLTSPASRGNWLYVGGSGPGNYTSIQDAIDNASNGDTIIVYYGIYDSIIINKGLTVIGINSTEGNRPYIHGNGHVPVIIQASGCTFNNFYWDYEGYGIVINSNNNTVLNCFWEYVGTGIQINSGDGNSIINNELNYGGIGIAGQGNHTLFYHNNFTGQSEHSVDYGGYNNCYIENIVGDFYVGDCFNSSFIGNTLKDFQLFRSKNDTFVNNTFTGNGLMLYGDLDQLNSHIVKGNTIHGRPIYYYANTINPVVPEDAAQVILVNCSHCILSGLKTPSSGSLSLLYCNNNTVRNNSIQTGSYGIYLYKSNNNSITNNDILGGNGGVYIDYGMNNAISSNSLSGFNIGLEFKYTVSDNISFNSISFCHWGIDLEHAENIIVFKNKISMSRQYGIFVFNSLNVPLIKNKISGSYIGINAVGASSLNCTNNLIMLNFIGIYLELCSHALVKKNNFLLNGWSATFIGIDNKWVGNFWGIRRFPVFFKIIFGQYKEPYGFYLPMPWIKIDWHPAFLPNYLGG
jgi:parallel beta-helix repeat protein